MASSAPMLERLSAMEATLSDFAVEMDLLRRVVRKEIKDIKKEVGGGDGKQAKKAKKRKAKETKEQQRETPDSAPDSTSSSSPLSPLLSANRESNNSKAEEDSPYDPEAAVTLSIIEAALRKQSEVQQKQFDAYLATFSQRLAEERKRRKKEGEKRYSRIDQLERELKGLRENVMQTLVMDARKVELIQKRDLKIRELEEALKREEEKERQLLAAAKHQEDSHEPPVSPRHPPARLPPEQVV